MSINASDYDWNIEITVGGVTFTAGGMETKSEAQGVASIVEQSTGLDVEVIRQ